MTIPSTSSAQPDLNWSQVRETVTVLNLSIAHISMTMSDGDESVTSLVKAVAGIANKLRDISAHLDTLDIADADKNKILSHCLDAQQQITSCTVAIQFYDKLGQRLDHVSSSLDGLSDLVADQSRLYNPNEWVKLHNLIKAKCSMEEQRELLRLVLDEGMSVEAAIRKVIEALSQDNDDVELF